MESYLDFRVVRRGFTICTVSSDDQHRCSKILDSTQMPSTAHPFCLYLYPSFRHSNSIYQPDVISAFLYVRAMIRWTSSEWPCNACLTSSCHRHAELAVCPMLFWFHPRPNGSCCYHQHVHHSSLPSAPYEKISVCLKHLSFVLPALK